MNILIFEDSNVLRLQPITTGRPAMAITCATFRLVDWMGSMGTDLSASVRQHLQPHLNADFPQFETSLRGQHPWTLCVNARLVPSVSNMQRLSQLLVSSVAKVINGGWSAIAAAVVPTTDLQSIDLNNNGQLENFLLQYTSGMEPTPIHLDSFDFPHDVVRFNLKVFEENLNYRLSLGHYREIADGVFVAGSATISDFVVTNTKSGPIVIEDDTAIGPFCFLRGPIYIGSKSRINEHSAIKDAVSLGHTTKIGGEVEGSIIEPYTNKQHHGFLGHSYLGSWINLGAGTCNSDLKNTYGEVKMEYGNDKVSSGMQFLGCIIGDYSKTAINTSIFTGKTIGVCSMVYGFVTTNVPSFVNYARSFGQVTEMPPGVMESTQRRMFTRRNVHQRPIDSELITAMHGLTQKERQMSEVPLSL
jgi:glucose-1-phosphate thymidylyltransferase